MMSCRGKAQGSPWRRQQHVVNQSGSPSKCKIENEIGLTAPKDVRPETERASDYWTLLLSHSTSIPPKRRRDAEKRPGGRGRLASTFARCLRRGNVHARSAALRLNILTYSEEVAVAIIPTIRCSRMDASIAFYTNVLDFDCVERGEGDPSFSILMREHDPLFLSSH